MTLTVVMNQIRFVLHAPNFCEFVQIEILNAIINIEFDAHLLKDLIILRVFLIYFVCNFNDMHMLARNKIG